jgi:hypothetical protein
LREVQVFFESLIESLFSLGREFAQALWKLISWGGNLSEDFESYSLGKGTCPRILKGLFLEMNLLEDFESFSIG